MRAQDSIEELAVKLKQSSMVEQDDMKASFAKVSLNNLLTPLMNNLLTYHDMKASFAKVSQSYTDILNSYKYLYLLYFKLFRVYSCTGSY